MSAAVSLALSGFLALQFAAQPLLTREFVSPEVIKSSFIIVAESVKLLACLLALAASGRLEPELHRWTLAASARASAAPAAVFAAQNLINFSAFRRLDGVTFNVLNQTKLLWTALFVFILRGKGQSPKQCLALLLIFAASVMTVVFQDSASEGRGVAASADAAGGAAAAVAGSALSGLGAVLTEVALVQKQRDVLLFSAELAAWGMLFVGLIAKLDASGDGGQSCTYGGFFAHWTPATFIPVVTLAAAGVIIGVLTKWLGSVQKGLTVTAGLLLSTVLRFFSRGRFPSPPVCGAVALAVMGVIWYAAQPPYGLRLLGRKFFRALGLPPLGPAPAPLQDGAVDGSAWVGAYATPSPGSCLKVADHNRLPLCASSVHKAYASALQ